MDFVWIEVPKAYYAEGDCIALYKEYGLDPKIHKVGYRSIHYTVSYKGVYCQTAHCGRDKQHFIFRAFASPTAQSCG